MKKKYDSPGLNNEFNDAENNEFDDYFHPGFTHNGDINQGNTIIVNVGGVTINTNLSINNNNVESFSRNHTLSEMKASQHSPFADVSEMKANQVSNEEQQNNGLTFTDGKLVTLSGVTLYPGASIKNELPQDSNNSNIKTEAADNARSTVFGNITGQFEILVRYHMMIPKGQNIIINKSDNGEQLKKLHTLTFEGSGTFINDSGQPLKVDTLIIKTNNLTKNEITKYLDNFDNILKIIVYENGNYELTGTVFHASEHQYDNLIFAAGATNSYYEYL